MTPTHSILAAAFSLFALLALAPLGCVRHHRSALPPTAAIAIDSITQDHRDYPYTVFLPPGYDSSRRWPAILFLHGRGESGTNGTRQLTVGLPKHLLWDSAHWPFILIMPQKPDEESQWEDHTAAVLAILDRAERDYAIDRDRITLTGLSQGGHGCWTIAAAAPDRFAAIVPVCGYASAPTESSTGRAWTFDSDSPELRTIISAIAPPKEHTPIWIFHGEADPIVPLAQSVSMRDLLRQVGADVQLTTYPGVGHDSWDRAYTDPELRDWMLMQSRGSQVR